MRKQYYESAKDLNVGKRKGARKQGVAKEGIGEGGRRREERKAGRWGREVTQEVWVGYGKRVGRKREWRLDQGRTRGRRRGWREEGRMERQGSGRRELALFSLNQVQNGRLVVTE